MNIVTINNKHYNLSSIVKIHDRQVFFNDGKSEIFTEPELQELFAWIFNEPRIEESPIIKAVKETKADLAKPVKKAKK